MIENVNRISANRETLRLADPNPLAQCRIEPKVRWARKDSLRRIAGRTRPRILKNNVSRTIHHDLVGKAAREICVASKIGQRCALCLEAREKLDESIANGGFRIVLRQRPNQICRVYV